jgi:hypothetical protein
VLAFATATTYCAILVEMDHRSGLINVKLFDQQAGCKKVVGLSLESLLDYHAQVICFSHLSIITAGDVFIYKDLENDFEDIKQTEPFVMSHGGQALESSFQLQPQMNIESQDLTKVLKQLVEEYN